jgi:hypothetical protein
MWRLFLPRKIETERPRSGGRRGAQPAADPLSWLLNGVASATGVPLQVVSTVGNVDTHHRRAGATDTHRMASALVADPPLPAARPHSVAEMEALLASLEVQVADLKARLHRRREAAEGCLDDDDASRRCRAGGDSHAGLNKHTNK